MISIDGRNNDIDRMKSLAISAPDDRLARTLVRARNVILANST